MKTKDLFKRIFWVFAALFLTLFCFVESAFSTNKVNAEETAVTFDSTNVLDDLEGLTVDGEPFSINDYSFNKKLSTNVFLFSEYCYSYDNEKQNKFGLYLYIWNPQGLDFLLNSKKNTVTLSYADTDNYYEYPLQYLNRSEKAGYEGLFVKYKITLTSEEKDEILSYLNSGERIYHIVSIDLLINGEINVNSYEVNAIYTFSGYAKGCGSPLSTENTLTYTKTQGEVLRLEPQSTFYRPEGSNGSNSYTQDTLMSVYFSIPNAVLNTYGRLSRIRASWLKALTKWGLVTGNDTIYEKFINYVGMNPNAYTYDSNYGLVATQDDTTVIYNLPLGANYDYTEQVGALCYLFSSGNDSNSADIYEVSSEDIYTWMKNYHDLYDNYVSKNISYVESSSGYYNTCNVTAYTPQGGAYLYVDGFNYGLSKALFSSWDSEETIIDLTPDDEFSLTSEVVDQTFWERLFHNTHIVSSDTFNGISAIYEVTDDDFKSSVTATCDGLYISQSDYISFKKYYDTAVSNNETVFLFRYDVGEYSAIEAHQGTWDFSGSLQGLDTIDTNARLFRQSVYLNFDIIEVELDNGTESVVLPVVMSPIDIVSSSTGALITTDDNESLWDELWDKIKTVLTYIVVGIGILIALVIVVPFIPYIVKFVVWLISLPFKLLGAVFKWIGTLFKKKNK